MSKQLILSMAKQYQDPHADLYYELDMENGGKGEVSFLDSETGLTFQWDRDKSNANIDKHEFSFYLAATVFKDEFWLSADKLGGKGSYRIIGKPFGDEKAPLVLVVESVVSREVVRIISAWFNESPRLEKAYEDLRYQKIATKRRQANQNVDFLVEGMNRAFGKAKK